jgi:N-dimethylarginine dimethylaminohydrolase
LACVAALPPDFLRRPRDRGIRVFEVSPEEVFEHACNVLATGPGRVISHTRNQRINDRLRAEGYELSILELGELARSGGGPRCLTLPLVRETG